MAFSSQAPSSRLALYAILLLAIILLAAGLMNSDALSVEARVREVLCRRLIANTTDGRQALVNSVWWAPLPTLLRLPIVAALPPGNIPYASLAISALFGALVIVSLIGMLRAWGAGWASYPIAAGVAANPAFLAECENGSSAMFTLFLMLGIAYGLVQWAGQRQLRALMCLGVSSALLLISCADLAPWVAGVCALMLVNEKLVRRGKQEKVSVLILALFPPLYAAGLWTLVNWLIMGDGLYFLRSLQAAGPTEGVVSLAGSEVSPFPYLFAAAAVLPLGDAVVRKNRVGFLLAAVCVMPIGVAWLLAARHYLWDTAPVLLSLIPFGGLALGYWAGRAPPSLTAARVLAALAPLVLSVAAWAAPEGATARAERTPEAGAMLSEGSVWLPRIERHVLGQSPYATVFACGYGSFSLLGPCDHRVFVHSLDFNFYKAAHDYQGRSLFLLVHRPRGVMAMDSIHWKYNNVYTVGAYSTLYAGDWGEWRLFEIIQGPRQRSETGY